MAYRGHSLNGAGTLDWLTHRQSQWSIDAQRRARRQAASNAAVSSKLKEVYSNVVSEPLPDSLAFLLDQLDQQSQTVDDA